MNRRGFLSLLGAAAGVALFKPLSLVVPTVRIKGLNHRFNSNYVQLKRKVFYQYPNGQAPLMGLLKLKDDEK